MDDLSASGSMIRRAAASMLAIAVVSVTLRFAVRLTARIPIMWSDWLILVSLAVDVAYSAMVIDYTVNGAGPRTFDLNDIMANFYTGGQLWAQSLLKMLYVSDLLFGFTITFAKLSILSFYYTIFSISKKFQIATFVLGGLCVVWLLVYLFLNIFQCHPIHAMWDYLASTEYCMPSGKLWLGYELPNFFLDVFILVLPIVMVHRLQLPLGHKLSVAGIFLLGGLVCITSILRMVYIWHPATPEFAEVPGTMLMAIIQLGIAILCACLPTYGPLLTMSRKAVHRIKEVKNITPLRTFGSSTRKSRSRALTTEDTANEDLQASPYYLVYDNESLPQHFQKVSNGGDTQSTPLVDLPARSILVQKSVDVR